MAHRVFHTRVLPRVLLPNSSEGLPDALHAEAMEACERMGGIDGSLVASGRRQATKRDKL
jgi:hypothetical protein